MKTIIMKEIISFKINSETEIPQDVIDDAPRTGPFDEYADYLYETFEVECSLADSIKYLKSTGAWEKSELQDLELNIKRVLWLAVMDCKENKTNYFYMGE